MVKGSAQTFGHRMNRCRLRPVHPFTNHCHHSRSEPLHSADTNHRKGLLITAIGGLALTVDIPLIRLAEGDPWPILMLRTGTTFLAAFVIWAIWRALSPNAPSLVPGKLGAVVAMLYGLGSITFVSGRLQHLDGQSRLHPRLHHHVRRAALLDIPQGAAAPGNAGHHGGDDRRRPDHRVRRHRHRQHLRRLLRALLGAD